jgi:hypothetical protein
MSFFLKPILVPEFYELPDDIVFFKVIQEGENPFDDRPMKQVYVTHKDHYSPYIATVGECSVFEDELMFLIHSDKQTSYYSVSTVDHYIIEKDKIEGVLNTNVEIGDAAENKLIQALKHDPSLKKKISQELKDRPRFKRKIELERTKGRIRVVDSVGESTGIVDITKLRPDLDLTDDTLHNIHAFLGEKPKELNSARRRKTMRITPPPQENARADWFTRFRRMFGKGTRKNKKKRYGRL